ncbi:hypothetical protein [Nocardia rhamnosiphila]|uniref:hypothetical protein n=1 Tax=Nocardia rhamnosiphila TaxID=426716 RepID=UPI003F4D0777
MRSPLSSIPAYRPIAGYNERTVTEAVAAIKELTKPADIRAVIAYEEANKNRQGNCVGFSGPTRGDRPGSRRNQLKPQLGHVVFLARVGGALFTARWLAFRPCPVAVAGDGQMSICGLVGQSRCAIHRELADAQAESPGREEFALFTRPFVLAKAVVYWLAGALLADTARALRSTYRLDCGHPRRTHPRPIATERVSVRWMTSPDRPSPGNLLAEYSG